MKIPRRLPWLLGLSLLVILADRLTKVWVESHVVLGTGIPVIPRVLRITHWTNDGAAFSLFADSASPNTVRWALTIFSLIAALAVLIMALGIGANTAVFSVVNAVLLKPLAYHDPDRIVTLTNPLTTGETSSPLAVKLVSIPNFQDWHDQSSSFEAMAFYYSWKNPVMAGSTAEYAQVTKVSPEFFRVFAVEPVVGRFFDAEESMPGGSGALLISYAYWQSHFGGDPGVLGRTIRRYNTAQTIVGVLPPGFRWRFGRRGPEQPGQYQRAGSHVRPSRSVAGAASRFPRMRRWRAPTGSCRRWCR